VVDPARPQRGQQRRCTFSGNCVVWTSPGPWTARPMLPEPWRTQVAPASLRALTWRQTPSILQRHEFRHLSPPGQWDYQPGRSRSGSSKAKDGAEKSIARDLWVAPDECRGPARRQTPFGRESLLQHYRARLERYRRTHGSERRRLRLKADDAAKLQQAAIQYHHRYICLFSWKIIPAWYATRSATWRCSVSSTNTLIRRTRPGRCCNSVRNC